MCGPKSRDWTLCSKNGSTVCLRRFEPSSTRAVPSNILTMHGFYCFSVILLHRPWYTGTTLSSYGDDQGKRERAAAKVMSILDMLC